MSVNIDVRFGVYGLAPADADAIYTLFEQVVEENRLEREVVISRRENPEGTRDVHVVSQHPVIFSGFYKWRPTFEKSLQLRVAEAVPLAKVVFDWNYPDED
ncbi:hypothetical protein [Rhodococcus globerulus]|uniref:hypothetical protein n=1 Tax=Rhodococcus globerulus TaxID=33008 RepID=UPI0011120C89|nr:hypothetical protein [Rhodococcus globerulus]